MLKTMQIYQEHIFFWVFVFFAIFGFVQKFIKKLGQKLGSYTLYRILHFF